MALIGIDRADVTPLASEPPAVAARTRCFRRPCGQPETSGRWLATRKAWPLMQLSDGLMLAEARDEREEARLIAILMRQTLENPKGPCGPRDG